MNLKVGERFDCFEDVLSAIIRLEDSSKMTYFQRDTRALIMQENVELIHMKILKFSSTVCCGVVVLVADHIRAKGKGVRTNQRLVKNVLFENYHLG